MDIEPDELGRCKWRKSWVPKSRGEGVFGHIDDQRTACFEGADAAAQVTVPQQSDEGRPPCPQRHRTGLLIDRQWSADIQTAANRSPRHLHQKIPLRSAEVLAG